MSVYTVIKGKKVDACGVVGLDYELGTNLRESSDGNDQRAPYGRSIV